MKNTGIDWRSEPVPPLVIMIYFLGLETTEVAVRSEYTEMGSITVSVEMGYKCDLGDVSLDLIPIQEVHFENAKDLGNIDNNS